MRMRFYKIVTRIRNIVGLAGIALVSLWVAIFLVWRFLGLSNASAIASIASALIGSLALVLFLWVYRLMGPSIQLGLGERVEAERPGLKYAFLHLAVTNQPLTGPLEKFWSKIFRVDRRHATCEVRLDFLSRDGKETYISSMPADWSSTSEPLSHFYDPSDSSLKAFPDVAKKAGRWVLDVRPTGYGEPIAVAVKHEGQRECYAFNSESYFGPTTGKPWCIERYKLDSKEVILNASLLSGGVTWKTLKLLLINNGTGIDKNAFRLEKLS